MYDVVTPIPRRRAPTTTNQSVALTRAAARAER
jgi:hypothetical protein